MTAQVLFFDVFSEKDPHLNAVEYQICSEKKERFHIMSNVNLSNISRFWYSLNSPQVECYTVFRTTNTLYEPPLFSKTQSLTKLRNIGKISKVSVARTYCPVSLKKLITTVVVIKTTIEQMSKFLILFNFAQFQTLFHTFCTVLPEYRVSCKFQYFDHF